MDYNEFLKRKVKRQLEDGFEIDESELNKSLFPFQKHCVKLALKKGRFALFLDTGMGKTICQLEWANWITKKTNKPVLILAPLAVSGQTILEGKKFDIHIEKLKSDVFGPGIYIINYEQLDNIKCDQFGGIVLDESSILKNFTGKRKQQIIDSFANTPYKLACTATPSPNDLMEIANHTEFLNIMSRNEVLAKFFIHDGSETQKWRIKGHGVKPFFEFMKSWAIMAEKPSDLGYSNKEYKLPKLILKEIHLQTPKRDNGQLFNDVVVNATNFNQELRDTLKQRLDAVVNVVNNSLDQWIVWIKQNKEGDYIRHLIEDGIEVKGSDSPEYKEKYLLGFARGEFRVLITKAKIAQFGLNYQNCHNQIFASLDFSFESQYQAIRRSYRFGQKDDVNIFLIKTDTMRNVGTAIKQKQEEFKKLQKQMRYE